MPSTIKAPPLPAALVRHAERRDTPVKDKRAARSLATSFEVTYEHWTLWAW
jgi:hypothetical protein